MKKVITSVMASVMLLCVGSAQAWCQPDGCYDQCAPCDPCCTQDGYYIGGFAGANWLTNSKHHHGRYNRRHKFDTGYALAASIGYRWCNFRAEFEYSYRRNQFKGRRYSERYSRNKAHVWSNSYLVNAFWDIPWCNDWCLKPFVGGGIGYATQRLGFRHSSRYNNSDKKNGFAWQVIAGLAYPICDNLDISLEYRFHKGRLKDVYSQNVGAGLRYYF